MAEAAKEKEESDPRYSHCPPSVGSGSGSGRIERSLIMVKPHGVRRGLVGQIIQRFEDKGAKLVALKFVMGSREEMTEHYIQHKDEVFFPALIDFMVSGPVVPMVWEGVNMVRVGRSLLGRKVFTRSIRGQFGLLPGHGNIIHGSDSVDAANREIDLWFNPQELVKSKPKSKCNVI